MSIDVARARAETPGCAHRSHLNNAGAGLMPQPVVDAQIAHIELESEIGGYEAHAAAQDKIDAAYAAVARLLNCAPTEVALMENATAAWSGAFSAFEFQPGDCILTAEAEYSANFIAYLQAARRSGVEIEVVPSEDNGQLDVAALENMIDDRVKLISVTHVPTNGGLVNPAEEIGRVARAAGIPYLIDACQSAGQIHLDVEKIGCDLLSVTGRKYLRGPRGSGFLYVRQSFLEERSLEPRILDMHGAEWVEPEKYVALPNARRFENWEYNYAAVIGLGVAVSVAEILFGANMAYQGYLHPLLLFLAAFWLTSRHMCFRFAATAAWCNLGLYAACAAVSSLEQWPVASVFAYNSSSLPGYNTTTRGHCEVQCTSTPGDEGYDACLAACQDVLGGGELEPELLEREVVVYEHLGRDWYTCTVARPSGNTSAWSNTPGQVWEAQAGAMQFFAVFAAFLCAALTILNYRSEVAERGGWEASTRVYELFLRDEEQDVKLEHLMEECMPLELVPVMKEGSSSVVLQALPDVTVVAVEFVGFEAWAKRVSATDAIMLLNTFYAEMDGVAKHCGCEKIKCCCISPTP